jgi:hypothetical protein
LKFVRWTTKSLNARTLYVHRSIILDFLSHKQYRYNQTITQRCELLEEALIDDEVVSDLGLGSYFWVHCLNPMYVKMKDSLPACEVRELLRKVIHQLDNPDMARPLDSLVEVGKTFGGVSHNPDTETSHNSYQEFLWNLQTIPKGKRIVDKVKEKCITFMKKVSEKLKKEFTDEVFKDMVTDELKRFTNATAESIFSTFRRTELSKIEFRKQQWHSMAKYNKCLVWLSKQPNKEAILKQAKRNRASILATIREDNQKLKKVRIEKYQPEK